MTAVFRNSAGSFTIVSEPGIFNQEFQKVSNVCRIVFPSAANPDHQTPKTTVVEHKGNATHLTADWAVTAAS